MKLVIINGSPKGKYSITLQTSLYLQKLFPEHQFIIFNVGQKIKALEKDFSEAKTLLEDADALIFSYPVYTFLAPSQLHRFIELIKSNSINLTGKYATQISTSKHFYDITAHKYIEENILDLNMKYIKGLSADMEDLLKEKGQKEAKDFFNRFLWSVKEEIYISNSENSEIKQKPLINIKTELKEEDVTKELETKKIDKDIVIITDSTDKSSNLYKMILTFQEKFEYKTRIVNLSDYPFGGGCLGCFKCAVSEKCVYKDNFDSFLRNNIQTSDAIIYAFTISDHSMGSTFKMYDDRNFCNGHRTVTIGMPVGYLISGYYSKENNLKTVIEARCDTGQNILCGVATDEYNPEKEIENLSKTLTYALKSKPTSPQTFWGIGGMKIFRDLIYQMRGMMKADHKFYKKQGIYDFPQKKWLESLKMYFVGALLSNEKILSKMGNAMNEGMIAPYKKLFEKLEKINDQKKLEE